jgi:threonine synthase
MSAAKRKTKQASEAVFRCDRCQASVPAAVTAWRCECGGPLSPVLPPLDPKAWQAGDHSVWRYRAALPLPPETEAVTLGEGGTPLVAVDLLRLPLHVKLEFLQPTGAYKDRGSAVLASALAAAEIRTASEDSSGNAGASLAAYCSRLNIKLRLYVPASTPESKLRQPVAFGAELDMTAETRDDAAELAQATADSTTAVYASHVYSPYFLAGQMTLAFEIWEQLGRTVPDVVVLPVGNGILLLGLHRGFRHLVDSGLAERVPRLFGVQVTNCAPLYRAFVRGRAEPVAVSGQPTIATGIRIARPARGREILAAIRESDGAMVRTTDGEVRRAQALVARLGWYVEPTAAVAVAGLAKLDKLIEDGACVVVPLTGSGLKS